MPLVRIDPPKRGRTVTTSVTKGALQGFAKGGPVGAIVGALEGLTLKRDPARFMVPLEVNTDTGVVQAFNTAEGKLAGARYGKPRDQERFNARGVEAAQILTQIYRTGEMAKVPKGYEQAAKIVQELSYSDPYTPAQRTDYSIYDGIADHEPRAQTQPEPEPYEDTFMGGFIPPGGLAGFSQMTAASRIALTGRSRGSTGTRRRKRRAKKASPVRRKRKARKAKGRKKKLVKGSAAAKRYMASIRRKRRG